MPPVCRCACVCVNKNISWLEDRRKNSTSVSCVPTLFADEILAFIFCFKKGGEHSDACRAWSSPASPVLPLFSWKLSSPGSSGDVITVQPTCKTHSLGECISLIEHSWLLFLTVCIKGRLFSFLFFSFRGPHSLLKRGASIHNREKEQGRNSSDARRQSAAKAPASRQGSQFRAEVELWHSGTCITAQKIMCNITRWRWRDGNIDQLAIMCHTLPCIIFQLLFSQRWAESWHNLFNGAAVDMEVTSLIICASLSWLIGFILSFIIMWAIWLQCGSGGREKNPNKPDCSGLCRVNIMKSLALALF